MCVHPAIQGCMVFYQMVVLLSSPQHSVLKKSPKLLAALFQPWCRRIFHYKSIMHLKWGAVVSCPFVCVHKSTLDCPGSKTPLKLHKAVEYCFTFVLEFVHGWLLPKLWGPGISGASLVIRSTVRNCKDISFSPSTPAICQQRPPHIVLLRKNAHLSLASA